MHRNPNRRELVKTLGMTGMGVAALAASSTRGNSAPTSKPKFRFGLNTSTIRGQKLPFDEEIDLIAKAGYDGFEPWVSEIANYRKSGGKLSDIRKRIQDHGLEVYGAIAFSQWIVDDDQQRAKGLEQAKRDMDLLSQIGGTHIAAPPSGATNQSDLNLFAAAERYRSLLELGDEMGVIPEVEVWGFSKSLSRLGEALFVAVESGHPKACLLPDVYHIYKGGSDFHGLKMINGASIPALHMNDYPSDPPQEKIGDGDRIFPGDGIAPIKQVLNDLWLGGFRGVLSLELFNKRYWEQDPMKVAVEGLTKMKAEVSKAF